MGRLCQTDGLTDDQTEILKAVRTFVDEQIIPVATELEHADEYPQEIVDGLKELGIFGLTIPEEYLDAARVDGCGELRILTTVVLRLARPAIAATHTPASRMETVCGFRPPTTNRSMASTTTKPSRVTAHIQNGTDIHPSSG